MHLSDKSGDLIKIKKRSKNLKDIFVFYPFEYTCKQMRARLT